jgi:hypothetical protein
MNIDLLFTQNGEAGLIASENLVKKASGIVLDTKNGILTLEYVDSDYQELNIPVESEFFAMLDLCGRIHVGAVKNGNIAQAYQIPLMFLDDPYRGQDIAQMVQPKNPLQAFNVFVKKVVSGQPVHRDDLGNEEAMGCILGDASPASLQFAPHLQRRHAMEVGPRAVPTHGLRYGGPAAPGLGSSGGGSGYYVPPTKKDEE